MNTPRRGRGPARLVTAVLALLVAAGVPACQHADRPVTSTVATAHGYTARMTLIPAEALPEAPPNGALSNLGYRLEISGPVAAQVDLEVRVVRDRTSVYAVDVVDRVAFRRGDGASSEEPLGVVDGVIPLPVDAEAGDEVIVLATVLLPDGWIQRPPTLRLRLERGEAGGLRGMPMRASDGASHRKSPATTAARSTRSSSRPIIAPTPRPAPTDRLPEAAAVARAAAVLPPAIYARARVRADQGESGSSRIWFEDLHASAAELRLPDAVPPPGRPRAAVTIGAVAVDLNAATGRVQRVEAFAHPRGMPEVSQDRASDALPSDHVVIFLPADSHLRARWHATHPVEFVRPVGRAELRAWGLVVVESTADLASAVAVGARALWLHRDAMPLVDREWIRDRFEEGVAIGVLDATMAELHDRFGLDADEPAWLRSDASQPIFALAQKCGRADGQRSDVRTSEHLSLPRLIEASKRALEHHCHRAR